jgi:hypothetical protein
VCIFWLMVHSVGQNSIPLKFSKSWTGSDMQCSCHHNSSPHSCSFTVRNSPLYLLHLWCQFVCKVTYPSRLHNKCLSLSLSSPFMPTTSSNSPPFCYPSILTQIYSRILHVFLSLCTKTFQLSCSKEKKKKTFKTSV